MPELYVENFEVEDGEDNLIFNLRVEVSSTKMEIFVNEISPEGRILYSKAYIAGTSFLRYKRSSDAPKRSS